MLKRLTIQNYALIDHIEIRFESGLHIVTGETGAGKSIILGALGLVMGNRADLKSLFDPERNCLVEATFDISTYGMEDLLKTNDIDPENELIIRRVIASNGKSRAFVNDLPVALKTLQDFSTKLVQLHHQFDNLDLVQPAYQLGMLDALAANGKLLDKYQHTYQAWKKEQKALQQLLDEVRAFEKEKDFIQFQYDEINQVDLEASLEEDYEGTLELLENAESIQQALQMAFYGLAEDENAVISKLKEITKVLQSSGGKTTMMEEFIVQLTDQAEQLESISNELYQRSESIEYDAERIAELQDKLDAINKLLHKHNVPEVSGLLVIRKEFEQKLSREMEVSSTIRQTEKNIEAIAVQLRSLAEELSIARKKAANEFAGKVENQLKELGMPHAQIAGHFNRMEALGPDGQDQFELLFSANKGSEPASIRNVASGGELSRLSLSIKSILAGHISMPTLIFDEIEAGISGEIALKMGNILKKLSFDHQIINITHSAQIASRGDHHFFVYKSHDQNKTITRIRELAPEDRINEIAKMLSGDPPTPTALQNATELIHLN